MKRPACWLAVCGACLDPFARALDDEGVLFGPMGAQALNTTKPVKLSVKVHRIVITTSFCSRYVLI
jgi:hypothetical protein